MLDDAAVFPTHVGMFRCSGQDLGMPTCFPHACGDVPSDGTVEVVTGKFSPRMWGCSAGSHRGGAHQRVFPTHVGMFRFIEIIEGAAFRFPHACGDVPS